MAHLPWRDSGASAARNSDAANGKYVLVCPIRGTFVSHHICTTLTPSCHARLRTPGNAWEHLRTPGFFRGLVVSLSRRPVVSLSRCLVVPWSRGLVVSSSRRPAHPCAPSTTQNKRGSDESLPPLAFAISRVLYSPCGEPLSFIYDDNLLPPPATYPSTLGEQPLIVDIHGLATHEAYCRGVSLPSRWALTPPFHPYPCGRLFSVTLLYPHGHQVVSLRGALCCSDFPPPHYVAAIERKCVAKVRKKNISTKQFL